jgi:hypothetical protein
MEYTKRITATLLLFSILTCNATSQEESVISLEERKKEFITAIGKIAKEVGPYVAIYCVMQTIFHISNLRHNEAPMYFWNQTSNCSRIQHKSWNLQNPFKRTKICHQYGGWQYWFLPNFKDRATSWYSGLSQGQALIAIELMCALYEIISHTYENHKKKKTIPQKTLPNFDDATSLEHDA